MRCLVGVLALAGAGCTEDKTLVLTVDAMSSQLVYYVANDGCKCPGYERWPAEGECVDVPDVRANCDCLVDCSGTVTVSIDMMPLATGTFDPAATLATSGLLPADLTIGLDTFSQADVAFAACGHSIDGPIAITFPTKPSITNMVDQGTSTHLEWLADPNLSYLVQASLNDAIDVRTCRTAMGASSFDVPAPATAAFSLHALRPSSSQTAGHASLDVWTTDSL